MSFTNETLMAYADGELDDETRAAVEAAMASDPDVARRVAGHMALASKVRAGFDPVLREVVPKRLKHAVAETAGAPASADVGSAAVIDISKARAVKQDRPKPTWSWPQWSAIAATLVIGVLAGRFGQSELAQTPMAMDSEGVVARGALEKALSTQLASTQPSDAPVRIGISFRSKSGEYCRTFVLANEVAGLGCKSGLDWRLQVVARSSTAAQSSGAYRTAAGETPAAVMREADERIAGNALDAREEAAALQRGWRK